MCVCVQEFFLYNRSVFSEYGNGFSGFIAVPLYDQIGFKGLVWSDGILSNRGGVC